MDHVVALLLLLIVLGALAYVVERYVPMAPPFKIAIRVVIVVVLLWYAFALLGIAPTLPRWRALS